MSHRPVGHPPTDTQLRRALARARDARPLDAAEAEVLLHARGDALDELMSHAARVRDAGLETAGRPGTVTYSKKVFIPLTRLCRDKCHYCTFAQPPALAGEPFLSPDEVLAIAEAGRRAGCKEALFTLGDRPEARWPVAGQWLGAAGYASTLEYVRAMSILVLEETGLLPHLNPGVMTWAELARLKPASASMGLMLESTSRWLVDDPAGPHHGSPDKDPAVRLRVLEDAGRSSIPFTTGILVGIGETYAERVDSILAIRRIATAYGGIQEVLIQNFRAKAGTPMRSRSDLALDEYLATIAVARLLLGPGARLQAPPNLVDGREASALLRAGVDDFGGISPVTRDHVNPERPWPQLDALGRVCAEAGFALVERLAVHPPYQSEPWLDPRVAGHVRALAGPDGLADPDALAQGAPWQEPDGGWAEHGRTDLATTIDVEGRRTAARSDVDSAFGSWDSVREHARSVTAPAVVGLDEVSAALRAAERAPHTVTDEQALHLMRADGAHLDALSRLADHLRREAVGDDVTYVVNRNINFTNVCYTGCRFCAFAQRRTDADAFTLSLEEVTRRAQEAWDSGATEVCMQGGIHPDMPGTAYFDIVRAVKERVPEIHVHAFSPMEVVNGASKSGLSIRDWLVRARDAGLGSLPGTAAEILDDDVRWILTKGKLPTSTWIEVITTAHRLGIPTTSTMMYGHVDHPGHWVTHLRTLARIQAETGGFTEFVPLPFVHQSSPIYLAGVARPGPTRRDNRAVHAMARVLLHGLIDNIQCSWVKLGDDGCLDMLSGGANDVGGTLMEETISRMAGSEHGSAKTVAELEALARRAGRPARERTTIYGPPGRHHLRAG